MSDKKKKEDTSKESNTVFNVNESFTKSITDFQGEPTSQAKTPWPIKITKPEEPEE